MSNRSRCITAIACAALALAPVSALAERQAPRTAKEARGMGRVPAGERVLLVTFADRPTVPQARARLGRIGAVRPSLPEIGVWELAPADPATARAKVLRRAGVRRAEWSLLRTTDALNDPPPQPPPTLPLLSLPTPSDPLYADQTKQWGHHLNTWSAGLTGYDRPTIAILDSGVDSTHEEWRDGGVLVFPRSTVRNDNRAEDVAVTGHGTHVAGIAAAPANGIGVVGVAPASPSPALPGVSKVIPIQIANAFGESSDATMIRGIRWAVGHGAKVVNISSGGPGYSQAFQDTVNWAFRRGALIVASVGNEGLDDNPLNFPAGYDHVVGVAAQCDGNRVAIDCPVPYARARFSNSNYSVDLLAPGVNIPSSLPLSVNNRLIAPGYGYKDGTSMAAPYVAGAAALVYASHPGITPFQVSRILFSTASRGAAGLPRTSSDGWGVVNPLAAAQAPAPPDDLSEINDDVKYLPKSQIIRLNGLTPRRITAWADFNDDVYDTYPIALRKGQRIRVTITGRTGRLGLQVFRPGATSLSLRIRTAAQLAAKRLGSARRTTPGVRSVVVRARESGRHFITVWAIAGGGRYTLKIQRL